MRLRRLYYLLSLVSFWYLFFVFSKLIFILYHFKRTAELQLSDISGIFYHGLLLDFSAIGYLMILPVFILIVTTFLHSNPEYFILKWYMYSTVCFLVFFVVTDLELYKYWGFRLDNTPLNYINNPEDMLASISLVTLFLGLLTVALISFGFILLYNRYTGYLLKDKSGERILSFIISIVLLPSLIVPIRGGFDTSPVNQSSAYFSTNTFANHASLNLLWNIGNSFTDNQEGKKYCFYIKSEAENELKELLYDDLSNPSVFKNKRPNIVLIILESFTAKTIETLGGTPGVTPGFKNLAGSGILFTNFYAVGDRSDKGICAILSGYPAFGTTSVLKYPEKTRKLPSVTQKLKENGYHTSFYYGGDINFFNFKSYFLNTGFQNIISKSDFKSEQILSKWGVPDEYVFERLLNDLSSENDTPFFRGMFSLSSHEPFDIPAKSYFSGNSEEIKFLNSIHYTDSCLYKFVDQFSRTKTWNNTLVIIMADHGSRHPGDIEYNNSLNFHIPMLWVGGAVSMDTVIAKYGSQLDVPTTLLNQLGLETDEFKYGKDLMAENKNGFAYYVFNDGFGFLNDSILYIYDHKSGTITGNTDENSGFVKGGKALLQISYEDFLIK